jgi:tellurite resistance protein
MEWLGIILFFLAWAFGPRLVASVTRAGWRAATGKGTFAGNFEASFSGMSAMQMRLRRERINSEKRSFDVYRIEVKGLFPVQIPTLVGTVASIFDATETDANGKPLLRPVTCFIDDAQEPESRCYQDLTKIGLIQPNTGFVDWQTVGNVIPETLTGPYSGPRTLRVFLRCFDIAHPPQIRHGFIDGEVLGTFAESFEYELTGKGYLEAIAERRRGEELIVQAAMSVALSDGSLADEEGTLIRQWISRTLDMVNDEERAARKEQFNSTLKKCFADGRAGKLDLAAVLEELARVGDDALKTEAVELCLDVMSADGHADQKELQQVNGIAEQLGVDLQRFQELKDKRIAGLSASISTAGDYHALLGIDQQWGNEEIRTHLNRLYSQWNSRAESLEDPEKRAQAERMLETIAGARKALLG